MAQKNKDVQRVFFKPFEKQRLNDDLLIVGGLELEPRPLMFLKSNIFFSHIMFCNV